MPYQARLQKLQKLVIENDVDAVIIDDPNTLYYLTGQQLSAGKVIASAEHARLMVDARYFESCERSSPIETVLLKEKALTETLSSAPFSFVKRLGFDSGRTSYAHFVKLQEDLSQCELKALSSLCSRLRLVKDFAEEQALRAAADLGSQGFDHICQLIKEGVTEKELALELEIFWRRHGGEKLAFDPIIAFGSNSSMPHYHVQDVALGVGQPVLIDIGVTYLHYNSDMTRTVFFGHPEPKMQEIYEVVHAAQEHALSLCKPGISAADLDKAARTVIDEAGFGEYFTHSLGHGIGLDVHEFPVLSHKRPEAKELLEPGVAITIEPGIYLPGVGGVRIEDTVLITDTGHDNLTQRSKDLTIIPLQ